MPDRENVIKGLECCLGDTRADLPNLCTICPYAHGSYATQTCGKKLREDALALLKAQEPRVMTLGQVRDEADHMYLEKHSKTGSDLYGCAIRGDWDGYGIELLMSEYDTARERWSDYGKTWRCWTSRPTDKQREATAWKT